MCLGRFETTDRVAQLGWHSDRRALAPTSNETALLSLVCRFFAAAAAAEALRLLAYSVSPLINKPKR